MRKELRIGNYVTGLWGDDYEERSTLCRVVALDDTGEMLDYHIWVESLEEGDEYYHSFEPIPLTEEWMVKLGWKSWGDKYTWSNKARGGVILHKRKDGWVLRRSVPVIKYVHQLQNLYYALTGKELEI